MLIVQYALEILSPSLKLAGLGVMIWLYIKNRTQPFLWLLLAMLSSVLVDVVGLFFATEVYVVEIDRAAKTYAYDVQRGLYVLHYLFLLLAGILFLKQRQSEAS